MLKILIASLCLSLSALGSECVHEKMTLERAIRTHYSGVVRVVRQSEYLFNVTHSDGLQYGYHVKREKHGDAFLYTINRDKLKTA